MYPLQVLKADGADDYSLVQIDVTTGALEALYDLTYVDGKANAVGLSRSRAPTRPRPRG